MKVSWLPKFILDIVEVYDRFVPPTVLSVAHCDGLASNATD